MTEEEKRQQRAQRDAAICAYYQAGHKMSECSSHFRLGKQRVLQILQQAGVWQPYQKHTRKAFLGVNVSETTKKALVEEAERQGVSVSKFTSDTLEAILGTDNEQSDIKEVLS